jgi:serine/threonine-protein kinase
VADDASGLPFGLLAGLGQGSIVGGYQVEDRIGIGGMAVVFRARDMRLGRPVALKVLAPALAANEEFRHRFIREWRAATAVEHPHIIPVYAADDAGDVLYIAMRLVSGGDLRTLVRGQGPLDPARTAGIVSAVASALDAAHAVGLVHRDVKPGNILFDTVAGLPDHVYLSDFGLSKGMTSSAGLTGTGQFLGTPDFAAPEQIVGKRLDGRADQYALACVAFTLLTASPVFPRDEPMSVLYAHVQEPPPSVAARCPGLPEAADAVLARALAKSPADRYPSCGEFAADLRIAIAAIPGPGGYAQTGDGLLGTGDLPRRAATASFAPSSDDSLTSPTRLRGIAGGASAPHRSPEAPDGLDGASGPSSSSGTRDVPGIGFLNLDHPTQARTAPALRAAASGQDTEPAKPTPGPAKPTPGPAIHQQKAGQGSRRARIAAAAAVLVLAAGGAAIAVLMTSNSGFSPAAADGTDPSASTSPAAVNDSSPPAATAPASVASPTATDSSAPSVATSPSVAETTPAAAPSTQQASPPSTAPVGQIPYGYGMAGLSCSNLGSIGSVAGGASASLEVGDVSDASVRVYYLGTQAQGYPVQFVTTVAPHSSVTLSATDGQDWMVETQGGTCMGVWRLQGAHPLIHVSNKTA